MLFPIHFSTFLPIALVLLQGSRQAVAVPVSSSSSSDESKQPTSSLAAQQQQQQQQQLQSPASASDWQHLSNAVAKALGALKSGQAASRDPNTPITTTSHGEGGPVDPAKKKSGTNVNDTRKPNPRASSTDKPKESSKTDSGTQSKTTESTAKDTKDSGAGNGNGTGADEAKKSQIRLVNYRKAALTALQQPRTRFCAQPSITNQTIDEISQTLVQAEKTKLAKLRKERQAKSNQKSDNTNRTDARSLTDARLLAENAKTVQIVWHVIHNGASGNLSQAMIDDQITTLNQDYSDFGFQFNLNTTNRVDNATWFTSITPGSDLERDMKTSLRKGNAQVLNLYTVSFQNGLLGYATFPWDVATNLADDGVVFQYSTVPGGDETGYNLGKTATHEVGHWLGLYHVFQGGCASPGDSVDDTPPQSVPTNGCPSSQDSCPAPGLDSIHNYMDYSTDPCLNQFTEGQAVRMAALTEDYRGI